MEKNIAVRVAKYLPLLINGQVDDLLDLFTGTPKLDDPRQGHIEGAKAFREFVSSSHDWLARRKARVEHVADTASNGRLVVESILHLE